jgi:hypothetical protein
MGKIGIGTGGGVVDGGEKQAINAMFSELYAAGKTVVAGAFVAGASTVTTITFTVKDANDVAVAAIHNLDIWVSDDADGNGLTATSASGGAYRNRGYNSYCLDCQKTHQCEY